jgi:hypothetical protein
VPPFRSPARLLLLYLYVLGHIVYVVYPGFRFQVPNRYKTGTKQVPAVPVQNRYSSDLNEIAIGCIPLILCMHPPLVAFITLNCLLGCAFSLSTDAVRQCSREHALLMHWCLATRQLASSNDIVLSMQQLRSYHIWHSGEFPRASQPGLFNPTRAP